MDRSDYADRSMDGRGMEKFLSDEARDPRDGCGDYFSYPGAAAQRLKCNRLHLCAKCRIQAREK